MNQVIRWLRDSPALLAVAVSAWILWDNGYRSLNELLAGNRATVYSTSAQIEGALLGFVLTAASVILGFSSSGRLALLIERGRFMGIMRSFFDAMRGCGVATAVSVIALLFDRDKAPSGVFFCVWLISIMWSIGNLIYCLYFFEMIVKAIVAPSKARGGTGMSAGTEIQQVTNKGKHLSASR